MNRKIIHKKTTIAVTLTLLLSIYATAYTIPAYALTNTSVTPSNDIPGQKSNYTVKFMASSLVSVKKVVITVPSDATITGAQVVKLEGYRVGTTLTADNGAHTLTLTQSRHTLFRPSQIKIAEFGNIVNPPVETAQTWTIQLFDRFNNLVDSGMVSVSLMNIERVGSTAAKEDSSADGKIDNSVACTPGTCDLTLDTLRVKTELRIGIATIIIDAATDSITTTGGTLTLSGSGGGVSITDSLSAAAISATSLTVSGLSTLTGGVDMNGGTITDSDGTVNINGATLEVGPSITINGATDTIDTTTGGGITVDDPLSVSGLATLSGGASVLSGLSVTGGTTTDGLISSGVIRPDLTASNVDLGSSTTFFDNLFIDNDIEYDGFEETAGGFKQSFVFTLKDFDNTATDLEPVGFKEVKSIRMPLSGSLLAISAQLDSMNFSMNDTVDCTASLSGGAAFTLTVTFATDGLGGQTSQAKNTTGDTFAPGETLKVTCGGIGGSLEGMEDIIVVVVVEY